MNFFGGGIFFPRFETKIGHHRTLGFSWGFGNPKIPKGLDVKPRNLFEISESDMFGHEIPNDFTM